jgi:hypothetical protein
MLQKLTSIKGDIKILLENLAELRDDDNILVSTYYSLLLGASLKGLSGEDVLKLIRHGSLPSADNITRVRRKLQADLPELRGEMYYKRKGLELEVRENIKEL